MKEQLDYLRGLTKDPDDLSGLPDAINALEKYHTELNAKSAEWVETEGKYQDRINKLQESNRSLISQIPVAGEPQETHDHVPTKEDTRQAFTNILTGGR